MGRKIIGIDPGASKSAFVLWDNKKILGRGIRPNEDLLEFLAYKWCGGPPKNTILAIETMSHIHIPKTGKLKGAGQDIIDTIFWAGGFYHTWQGEKAKVPVHVVRKALGGKDDPGIRAALIIRFGEKFCHDLRGKGYHLYRAFATAVVWMDHLAFQARELK